MLLYTNKTVYSQNSTQGVHINYSISNDTLFYIILQHTIPSDIGQDYFSHKIRITSPDTSQRDSYNFTSKLMHAPLLSTKNIVFNFITPKKDISTCDSLLITLRYTGKSITQSVAITTKKKKSQTYLLVNNKAFAWNEPFVIQNQQYLIPQANYFLHTHSSPSLIKGDFSPSVYSSSAKGNNFSIISLK
ncbi:MAG: hypothetical protein R6U95_04885 [Bacteroidales bacterium]